jgi:hypothetical protein
MKSILGMFSILVFSQFSVHANAENLTANNCEIFIKSVKAIQSSHGYTAMSAIIKVGWIGNGEFVQKVGFYGKSTYTDLGNASSCYQSSPNDGQYQVMDPYSYASSLAYGEYQFDFNIYSGSVSSYCPGRDTSTQGSFFVQTNKNTYWLNPDKDSSKEFFFDMNGFKQMASKGLYNNVSTSRSDMTYYNPGQCK